MRHSIIAVLKKTGLIVAAFCLLSVHFSEISKSSAADKALASTAATASLDLRAIAKDVDPATRASVEENYGKLPLSFEANNGQVDDAVKFLARGSGYTLFLTSTEAVLSLRHGKAKDPMAKPGREPKESRPVGNDVVRLKLIGANSKPKMAGLDELPGKSNYFIGKDPAKWRKDVSNYSKVKIEDVYPGIDLVYYGNQRQLEYDWIVDPGTDPGVIKFAVEGKADLKVNARGDLILDKGGDLRLNRPFIYQQRAGLRTEVAGRYILHGKREVGFQLEKYDASLPLVVDPVLTYSTYLGGAGSDYGQAIAVDSSGNAYVTGYTTSTNFPTANALQASNVNEYIDAFVTKLNASGSALLYSTYLGGSSYDTGWGIAVDSSGNAYMTGETYSSDFPTAYALQASYGGGSYDGFVTKLNASGNALIYSTYLGGSNDDRGFGIAVDSIGNAYVTGETYSSDFPTANPFQASYGGLRDSFVTKLNASGTALVYASYLGGANADYGYRIAVDSIGNAYVTGETYSSDFPTANPFQASNANEYVDVFVTKLNASGSALIYSTYLGGSDYDTGCGITVDSSSNAYVTGYTFSTDFPTANPFQANKGGNWDVFVTKLNASGNALVYSTYLGGNGDDRGAGIAVDSIGNAYVTGYTFSTDFPTANPFQASNRGNINAFVTKLNASGNALVYSTYLGGNSDDRGAGIAVDSIGNAYVTGYAFSTDFPTTNPFQAINSGSADVFISKIRFSGSANGDVNGDGRPDVLWRNTSTGENYIWYLDGVTVLGGGSLPPVTDQNWKAVGVADFNNNGKPDILWRKTSTGENYIWYLDGVTVLGGGSLPPVTDQNWKAVGAADFNNDGKPDVLWRNTSTGENYIWYLDGVTVMGGGSLPAVVDQNWKLVGTADFNNDGDPDILWRNTSTGENYIWYLDGVTVLGGGSLPPVSGQSWKVVGVTDFNIDGNPDVLWRNTSTGDNYIWYLDGVTVLGGGSLPTVADQNWTIVPQGSY